MEETDEFPASGLLQSSHGLLDQLSRNEHHSVSPAETMEAPFELAATADVNDLSKEELVHLVEQLRMGEDKFRREKNELGEEFGRHRAMFKEMYMQKEGEIGQANQQFVSSVADYQRLRADYAAVQLELAELKSVALVAETASKEEMTAMKERFSQEVASMEQAMRAMIEDAEQTTERKFHTDRNQLIDANYRLKTENEELSRRLQTVDQGFLASLGRKVGVGSVPGSPVNVIVNKALKSRSPSLDEESYNREMRRAKDDADVLKAIVLPLEEEIRVLKSQLQEAVEKVDYYEQEKLKLNFQSSVSLDSLAKKFGAKEFDLSTASKSDIEMYLGVLQTQKVVLQDEAVNCRRELGKAQKMLEQERELSQYLRKCLNSAQPSPVKNRSENSLDILKADSQSLRSTGDGDESPTNNLPLLDLALPSDFDSHSTTSTPTAITGSFEDSLLVSSQESGSSPKRNVIHAPAGSESCDMCANYELQLQAVQKLETRLRLELADATRSAERSRDDLKREQQFRSDIDVRITKSMEETQTQISDLYKRLADSEKLFLEAQEAHSKAKKFVEQNLREVWTERESAVHEMDFLKAENDRLVDRYSRHSRQLQDETINLPTEMDELHLILLQYREDVIHNRIAKEHTEESLNSEILLLRDRFTSEQQSKESVIEMLSKEVDALRERIAILDSEKSEVIRQHRTLTDQNLEENLASRNATVHELRQELSNVLADKAQLDKDLHQSRSRSQAMQIDLDNSEAVQRDFVKLSQSLQVELEKIRQSENEVRWQFDEDVTDCNACGQPFLLPKGKVRSLKIHCRHCGKIFCRDCLSKEAQSGPNRRSAKVCDVCHTILNRDTAPYFSTTAPAQR